MLLTLARCGVIVLTLFFVLWVVFEIKHREGISRVIFRGSGGDDDVTNFRFGGKLALAFFLGLPALAILWSLDT